MKGQPKRARLVVRAVTRPEATLSSSIVIHVLRPYANEEEYLAHEASSIDAKSMVLIDQAQLPLETAIVFDVQLEGGQKPIRAEAKVMGPVAASGGKPAGLRVRFKRFGAATKAFIDRAVALNAASRGLDAPPSLPSLSSSSMAAVVEDRELRTTSPGGNARVEREPSGIHRKPVAPVPAPANREELLERLRVRARAVPRITLPEGDERAS